MPINVEISEWFPVKILNFLRTMFWVYSPLEIAIQICSLELQYTHSNDKFTEKVSQVENKRF